jgi:hypothetical protein
LANSEVPYENVYWTFGGEEFKKAKEEGKLMEFNQLPVL